MEDNRRDGNFKGKGFKVIALLFEHISNEKGDIIVLLVMEDSAVIRK